MTEEQMTPLIPVYARKGHKVVHRGDVATEEEAIEKARDEMDAASNRETFRQRFEPMLVTLEP